jgi:hypothetical protein
MVGVLTNHFSIPLQSVYRLVITSSEGIKVLKMRCFGLCDPDGVVCKWVIDELHKCEPFGFGQFPTGGVLLMVGVLTNHFCIPRQSLRRLVKTPTGGKNRKIMLVYPSF